MHPCEDATAKLLKELDIKYTRQYLQKELQMHPDYPSLAAIADVIGISYDVACVSLRISIKQFQQSSDFRKPFLAQLKSQRNNYDIFAVVTKLSNDQIDLYNPDTKKTEKYTIDSFNALYRGVILIVEKGSKLQEDNYEINLKVEKKDIFFKTIASTAIPIAAIITAGLYLFTNPIVTAAPSIFFMLLTLVGSSITALLIWHEIDEYNPVIKQICQARAKVNCSSVLNSKAAKVKGMSWSSIGFVFFTGMLLALVCSGLSTSALILSGWSSAFALPYTIFSIYYQSRVIKQWCPLCLMVQGILLLLFITALTQGVYSISAFKSLSISSVLAYTTSFLFTLSAIVIIIPALQKAKISKQKTIALHRIKNNPQIFEALLAKQINVIAPPAGLGINIGKSDSIYRIIKVCNPYCGPCASSHPIIEELIATNDEVSLQIIFTATNNEKDVRRAPVLHLLAIATKGDESLTKQALHAWYSAPKKDYPTFAAKYPININQESQIEKLSLMEKWCEEAQISFTPTFFVSINNNHKEGKSQYHLLPDMYTISDLQYFFTT